MNPLAWVVIILVVCSAIVACARYFFHTRMRSSASALTASKEYRALAEEYRRLSDLAITANEHVDLRLTDLSVQLDELRDRLDQVQQILKDVE
jgi:hypothetical protein